MAARDAVLDVAGVRKAYGEVVALDGVDLTIAPGQILGLLGANGAGKTTLVSIVAGLRAPDAGSVRVGGIDVQSDPIAARRLIGIAPQEIGVYLQLTVRQNLRFFGRLMGLRGRDLERRIDEIGSALSLERLFDRRAFDLSGGEKRRLHTAAAMLHRPPLLLLDEPTAGIDVETRQALLALIKRLAGDGVGICYTTHYLHEVEALGASVAILERGRVIARGDLDELIAGSGGAVVEIRVAGDVPAPVAALGTVDGDRSLLRIQSEDPTAAVQRALASVARAGETVTSIEIVEPSLESVYLTVTGRRYEEGAR
jgi:ABC-2 type transport system ATP-binding protein